VVGPEGTEGPEGIGAGGTIAGLGVGLGLGFDEEKTLDKFPIYIISLFYSLFSIYISR